MTVAYAEPADAAALEALFRAIVAPLTLYSEAARAAQLATHEAAHFAAMIAADRQAVIIARRDGRPSGFAILVDEHGPIWLDWYGVAPDAQGQGIGGQLLAFIVAEGRRRNATRIWCDTRAANTTSNALLERIGFRRLCALPNHWYGEDYLLWDKSPL